MIKCPSCSREILDDSRVCSYCGESVDHKEAGATVTTPERDSGNANVRVFTDAQPHERYEPSSGSSSDSIDQARFTPGAMLTERYRIVGLLGKGGMGEVYRADDLKLRQPVALKFLPAALSRDQHKLERFHHEVRVARQVSHPNVCRVYDIGEANGQTFISMEYIDGEDLASVLRRMGRPSQDKAIQIARQLCAGIAAAHDKGVLHRDLKPHNVMIDGDGKVRITDFGLAGFVEDFAGRDVAAGTPAYMAPEQVAGREVSVKSDIYSLGVVLYELFTGKRLFDGTTREQVQQARTATSVTTISTREDAVDPAVERVILRCLEHEPAARPSSAMAVAAALPGGDPLAAALAAGETPDPSLVAAAGEAGGLRPGVALACLVTTLVALAAVIPLSQKAKLENRVPLPYPPQVLVAKARDIIVDLGYEDPPVDSAHAFFSDTDYLQYVTDNDKSANRWDALNAGTVPVIKFWYRQSPQHLKSTGFFGGTGRVSGNYPPANRSGMAEVMLDPAGHLYELTIVPPQVDEPIADPQEPDWSELFEHAGLDMSRFQRVDSTWTPPVWADLRAAWKGTTADAPELEVRIEAASYRSKPVYFNRVLPWTRPARMTQRAERTGQSAEEAILIGFLLTILLGSILVAHRNLRLGRGDRVGASRLALFVVIASLLAWVFSAHHVPTLFEFGLFVLAAGWSLFLAGIIWLVYIAVEPYLRKHWPHALISWSRLLAGRVRDPLVGRDLLVGSAIGVLFSVGVHVQSFGVTWFGAPPPEPISNQLDSLLGVGYIVAAVLRDLSVNAFFPLGFFFLFFLLRLMFRKIWLAAVGFILIFLALGLVQSEDKMFTAITSPIFSGIILAVLLRFGVLTLVVVFFVGGLTMDFPLTYDFDVWYFRSSLVPIVVIVGLAAYGFHTALAGRSLFKDDLLET